jgi:N6-adenosine-specific RNA methylase IME4
VKFGTIIADPPWGYSSTSGNSSLKGYADKKYTLLTHEDLMDLRVKKIAAEDSVLLLWTVAPFISDALELMERWGFDYKTMVTWGKVKKGGTVNAGGVGFWFRGAAEYVMIGKRGKWKVPQTGEPGLLLSENLLLSPKKKQHSEKPNWMHEHAEKYFSGGFLQTKGEPKPLPDLTPRLELFGRRQREGWEVVGNEGDLKILEDVEDSIERLIKA